MARNPKKEAFTVTWRIENFSMCPHKNNDFLLSPNFVVDELDKTRWLLKMYPKGYGDCNVDHVSMFLGRKSKKEEPNEIVIDYSLAVVNIDIESSKYYQRTRTFVKDTDFGFPKAISHKDIFSNKSGFVPNDVLTIQCRMWQVPGGKESPAKSKELKNIVPATTFATAVSLEEISSVVSTHGSEVPSVSCEHYRFCTRIEVERRQITWTIKNFKAIMQSTRRTSVSVESDSSALLLSCYATGDGNKGSVRIDIHRKDKYLKQTRVKCKVSVLDRKGVAQEPKEDEYVFGEDYEIWSFPPVIKLSTLEIRKSALLDRDQLCLRCEFLISYRGGSGGVDPLSRAMHQLLCDGKSLTDVRLIYEGSERAVHKSVLCARSPVFRAMFSEDTQENRTGVVRITDIDTETINFMRYFLYNGFVLELQPEDYFKLYSAADKYELLSLKKQCSSSMKYNLSQSTVCDVLTLADMHQDSDLGKYVENFLCANAKDIFQSTEWKDLMKKNSQLAGETMRKALAKITNS